MTRGGLFKAGQPLMAVIGLCLSWSVMRVMAHDPFGRRIAPHAPRLIRPLVHQTLAPFAHHRHVPAMMQPAVVQPHAHVRQTELRPLRRLSRQEHQTPDLTLMTPPVSPPRFIARLASADRPGPATLASLDRTRFAPPPAAQRLRASGWMIVRPGRSANDAGTPAILGGSQIGSRILLPVYQGLSLMAGANAPLQGRIGREIRLGLSWQPLQRLPLELIAERRTGVSAQTRSRTVLMAAAGFSRNPRGGAWSINGYAQGGAALGRQTIGFVEGQAVATRPLDGTGLHAGGGVWGATQPGLNRLDIGPVIEMPFRLDGRAARLSLQWRHRVAGNARPASGPALTLGADF